MLIQSDAPGLGGRKDMEETFFLLVHGSEQTVVVQGQSWAGSQKSPELVRQRQVTSWASFPH